MNAPLPDEVLKALAEVRLDDKYRLDQGRAFMSGVQALVRLTLLQHERDRRAGLDTAGFVSGYRGSPLGTLDQALWQAKDHLQRHQVVFQPGVNEELAATAVWGSQQLDLWPQAKKHDGVYGLWYGKGPGVDRSADVLKHANYAGTARHGGVIAVAGDDHVAKSSTIAHQSDHLFKACGIPVFFPASVQEILDLGLHAWAMSRYAGLWSGFKTIQEIVESSSSVEIDPDRVRIVLPDDFPLPAGGLHIRWPDTPLEQEARLMDHKWYAALAYVRANRLNHDVVAGPADRFGLIASGKAYNDTRQALHDLGLDDAACRRIGLRLHKVAVPWPLEARTTREFAQGLQEILVVEEKRQLIEYQLKEELYNWRPDVRPNVLGKFDEPDGDHSGGEWSWGQPADHWLLRAKADLTPALIARAIARRLQRLGVPADVQARMAAHLSVLDAAARREQAVQASTAAGAGATGERAPWFCAGCPHNTSTRVPEGSRAMAGIGCHYMALWMDRQTETFSQMGGEGVAWVGQAPFTKDAHVFANLGDGTYFHSGVLAVRQAVAAGVNITYKILFNDAVAMTGGQPVDGTLRVPALIRELQAEGVTRVVLVSDRIDPWRDAGLPADVALHPREDLDAVQRTLREVPGCTVIVYEQTCATEKRRRRKRGTLADAGVRVVINEAVCEGCGDCSVQSNCLAVEPVETPLGRKRRINQSACNQDLSCLHGFCPSFVTLEGAVPRQPKAAAPASAADVDALPPLPEPTLPDAGAGWRCVVAGVGGTGVITLGQLLGMAAHLDGKAVVTQDAAGLAQKGGATWSHVQVAGAADALRTTKIDAAQADLLLACDGLVAALPVTLQALHPQRSRVVLNTHPTPTAALLQQPDWQYPAAACEQRLREAAARLWAVDAEALSVALLGDAVYANPLLLGHAWQRGLIPLSRAAIRQAMVLNGVQPQRNQAAFEWGRRAAHDPASLPRPNTGAQVIQLHRRLGIEALIDDRAQRLAAYQSAAYADTFRAFVAQVRLAEAPLGSTRLAQAVAEGLHKLMAYKDEYEVARLHADPAFAERLQREFDGGRPHWHLAPPGLARRLDAQGRPRKLRFGPWLGAVYPWLARLKVLRGTPFDPFGRTEERRTERALVGEYRAAITELLPDLRADNLALALEIARLPERIRGFGPVKARHLAEVRPRWQALMTQWRTLVRRPPAPARAQG
ncbi:indolepyruvate ferredoxin oxidoreductase family protein [Aquabacterium sp. J223]|uniref:indolepyruvate ferredoxin oxidoreductase family protein n=1 Tax=Aquabacterium sp. J223 TaxID=2898431 RepID=UPI0021ADC1B9|nr:indolepyruvate ferredoxin oxidoreductase family protein [Aquabacterium sp. J223]UUX96344.1 indolepyruvate ferredoxin oxidoreductase family protein [Aquabacterium sp. J223]